MITVKLLKECLPSLYRIFKAPENNRLAISYLRMYPHFTNYLDCQEQINGVILTIAAGYTYSWMNTPIKFHADNDDSINNAAMVVQNAKDTCSFKSAMEIDISQLKSVISNSYIGCSKLLHFANPECFPIYDSNICKSIFKECTKNHHVNTKFRFYKYFEQISKVTSEPGFQSDILVPVIEQLKTNGLPPVSSLRAAEMVLFYRAREQG